MNMRLVMNIQLLFLLWTFLHILLPHGATRKSQPSELWAKFISFIYILSILGHFVMVTHNELRQRRISAILRSIWGFGGTHFSPVLFYQRPWRHPLSYLGKGKREVILSVMRQKGSTSDLIQTISKVPSTLKILNLLPDLVTAQISWVELLPLNLTLNTNLNHVREWARRKLASPYPSLLIFNFTIITHFDFFLSFWIHGSVEPLIFPEEIFS